MSRKFIIALLSLLSCTVLMALKTITPAVYGGVVGLILTLYSAANVAQNLVDKSGWRAGS